MKKINIFLVSLITLLPFSSYSKYKVNAGVELSFKAGHTQAQCGGFGEILYLGGTYLVTHVPCMNFGSSCSWKIKLGLGSVSDGSMPAENNPYEAELMFIDNAVNEEIFTFANRSIWSEFEKMYVNIPAQNSRAYVNEAGVHCYKVNNVIFTKLPMYSND